MGGWSTTGLAFVMLLARWWGQCCSQFEEVLYGGKQTCSPALSGIVSALDIARSGHDPPPLEPGRAAPPWSIPHLSYTACERSRPCAMVRGGAVGVERHTDPLVDQGHGLGHAPEGPGIPWSADGDQGPFCWVYNPVYADNMMVGLGMSLAFLSLPPSSPSSLSARPPSNRRYRAHPWPSEPSARLTGPHGKVLALPLSLTYAH